MKKGNKTENIRISTTNRTCVPRRFDCLKPLCWIIIPLITVALLILDGFGVYTFTVERLIVLGIALLVLLLPFFSEITIKNLSVKRREDDPKPPV